MRQVSIDMVVVDGAHVYVERANPRDWVWLGYEKHLAALTEKQTVALVKYRLEFDRRCCERVN